MKMNMEMERITKLKRKEENDFDGRGKIKEEVCRVFYFRFRLREEGRELQQWDGREL